MQRCDADRAAKTNALQVSVISAVALCLSLCVCLSLSLCLCLSVSLSRSRSLSLSLSLSISVSLYFSVSAHCENGFMLPCGSVSFPEVELPTSRSPATHPSRPRRNDGVAVSVLVATGVTRRYRMSRGSPRTRRTSAHAGLGVMRWRLQSLPVQRINPDRPLPVCDGSALPMVPCFHMKHWSLGAPDKKE